MHAYATFEYNNLKSFSGIPKQEYIAVATTETVPRECRRARKLSDPNVTVLL